MSVTIDPVEQLYELGYFANEGVASVDDAKAKVASAGGTTLLRALVSRYQKFHGLKDDGDVGDVTLRQMARPRCAVPDFIMGDELCRWPHHNPTWFQALSLDPGLVPPAKVQAAFRQAWGAWAAVCNLNPIEVATAATANVISNSGRGRANQLDGRGGTLAWSELPCGSIGPKDHLQQMYDELELWTYDMLVGVITHEVGHALGLPHLPAGNLMQPYFDPRFIKPQTGDIEQMVLRYGGRTTPPTTPPPTQPGPKVEGSILIDGVPFQLVRKAA